MNRIIFGMLTMFAAVPVAFAEDTTPAASAHGGGLSSIIMFGAIFAMMYFLMIRPQSKRAKEHRELLSNLTKDDEVVTQGGLIGKIVRNTDGFIIIAISEGVEIPVQKQAIVQVLPKGTLKTIC